MNAIPLYEAKNKLPHFMHQAESLGPVFISRRNKTVGVLLSFEEYKKLTASKKDESILERAAEFREKTAGLFTNEDIDMIFNSRNESSDTYESDVFNGVF